MLVSTTTSHLNESFVKNEISDRATLNTITHMAAEVTASTPLPTELLRVPDSIEASIHLTLLALPESFFIMSVTPFSISGKRNASAITEHIRQIPRRTISFLMKNVTMAPARKTNPKTIPKVLNLYAVSLLSKIISLIDVLIALSSAFIGMMHSISTAPNTTHHPR